jgi:hypothetical protein
MTTTISTTIPSITQQILATPTQIEDEEITDKPAIFTDDEMKIDVEVDSVKSPIGVGAGAAEFKYSKPFNTIPFKLSDIPKTSSNTSESNSSTSSKKESTNDIINNAINYVETFSGVNKKNARIIFCILLAVLLIRLFCI